MVNCFIVSFLSAGCESFSILPLPEIFFTRHVSLYIVFGCENCEFCGFLYSGFFHTLPKNIVRVMTPHKREKNTFVTINRISVSEGTCQDVREPLLKLGTQK